MADSAGCWLIAAARRAHSFVRLTGRSNGWGLIERLWLCQIHYVLNLLISCCAWHNTLRG